MSNTTLILIFFFKKFKYSVIFFEKAHQPVLGKGGPTILFSFRKKNKKEKTQTCFKNFRVFVQTSCGPLGVILHLEEEVEK
jgi:hypothetical protein